MSVAATAGRLWAWVKGPEIPREKRWSPTTVMNILCICGIVFILGGRFIQESIRIGMVTAELQCIPGRFFLMWIDRDPVLDRGDTYVYRSRGLAPFVQDGVLIVKKAAALPGDRVRVDGSGIYINGAFWGPLNPVTMREAKLTVGQITKEYVVQKDEVVMLGTLPRSFDARYTGPIKYEQILGGAQRLW